MKTEDLVLDDGSQREIVEQVSEGSPDVGRTVLAHALVVKAVDLCNLARFVISSQDVHALGVADLVAEEKRDSFDRVVATIDVVTHEEIVRIGWEATDLEQFHQIVELAVDIAANSNGGLDGVDIAFLAEDFTGFDTELVDLRFREGFAFEQLSDEGIEVEFGNFGGSRIC